MDNYQKELESIILDLSKSNKKPKLLMHACCAPCSSYCLEYLSNYFDVTIYFYNPNITSEEEYLKRYNEFEKIQHAIANVPIVETEYNNSEFYNEVKGYENCKEGGARCYICYKLRLEKTAKFAKEKGFDYFVSTLSISPHKNAEWLNTIGNELEKEYNIKYLPNDFKKKGGYLRSIELSRELGLYRQNYCGCIYSQKKEIEDAR